MEVVPLSTRFGHRRLPAPAPTTPGSGSPAASASNKSKNQEQQHRADRGVDNRGDDSKAKMDAELRQEPASDESSYDADYMKAPTTPIMRSLTIPYPVPRTI